MNDLTNEQQAAIDAVIEKHSIVRQLLENDWLHMWRFHESGFVRYGEGVWMPVLVTDF